MSGNSLNNYFEKISQIPVLDKEGEEFFASFLDGDNEKDKQDAINILIESNLRLVVKIAHSFKGCGLSFDDIVSNGNIGLVKAAHKYKTELGTRFSTYAAIWIKQAIKRGICNQSRTIRIPEKFYGKFAKIRKAEKELMVELDRKPTDSEICERAGITQRILNNIRKNQVNVFSLDEKISEDSDMEVIEVVGIDNNSSPRESMVEKEDYKLISNYIDFLSPNEKLVIELRFGLNGNPQSSLSDISSKINRTKERVRQIQNNALEKLKRIYYEDHKVMQEVKKTTDIEKAPETQETYATAQDSLRN